MNKLKTALILLLTLFVLAVGAFFPKIVSSIQDLHHNGRSSSSPITAVELEIVKDISPVARLIMLSNADSFTEVTENITAMTKDDALNAARTGLAPYIESGLIAYCEDEISITPMLVQVSSMPDLQGIVWLVHLMGDAGGISSITLTVDDDTGHILQIAYTHEDVTAVNPAEETLSIWTDIFFSSLEIEHLSEKIAVESAYEDGSHAAQQYSLSDPEYGQVFVDLFLYPYGFSIECVPE